jgi:hypothetical protein
MTREIIIQNIMNNYGKYGITQDMVEEVIDSGLEEGMNYDMIYLDMCRRISEITGEEFVCSSSDLARAYGVSDEEMQRLIEKAREELIESGEDPDEYFREVSVHRVRW